MLCDGSIRDVNALMLIVSRFDDGSQSVKKWIRTNISGNKMFSVDNLQFHKIMIRAFFSLFSFRIPGSVVANFMFSPFRVAENQR